MSDEARDARLFAAIRQIAGRGLTQAEVDLVKAALNPAQTEVQHGASALPTPFDTALALILRHEGGYVNHPSDPGGMTNLGVTKGTWEAWLGRTCTEAEMRALTPVTVAPVYRANYWDRLHCDDLHPALALCVFDFGVNAGPNRAAKFLQRLVEVPDDGIVGPATVAAAQAYVRARGSAAAVQGYSRMREQYYRALRTFPTFGKGWLRRVAETETQALRLS